MVTKKLQTRELQQMDLLTIVKRHQLERNNGIMLYRIRFQGLEPNTSAAFSTSPDIACIPATTLTLTKTVARQTSPLYALMV